MEIVYSGYVDKSVIRVGNWVVYKTSSNGVIVDPLKQGIVRFIGQIYKVDTSYTHDKSAGHRRRAIKISVREWSHLLFCPVRFDPYAVAGQSFSSVVQTVDSTAALSAPSKPWLPNYLNQQQLTNAPLDLKPEQIHKSEIPVQSHESKVDTPRDVIQDINMLFVKYRQPFAYVTSGGAIEYDIVFDCVRNTETHESIFPDQFGFPREFREALIASAIDADQCAQTEARAEKYWAEYDAEEKSMTVSCHTVFLKKGEPAKTIIVYETRGRVVRYRLIEDAPNTPMRYADELPEPIIEYLNWVASGCPSIQPAQIEL
jgi:hypothetical protein